MAYTLQFGKTTTLASVMSDSETSSATLSSAAFTNFTADYLVLDYDVPAKREVIKCTVTGTAISSITRAQEGTSAVEHAAGAKVGYNFVPSHYGDLGKIAASDAWTTYAPAATGFSSKTSDTGSYQQIGKIVFADVSINGTSNATTLTFTLPVAPKKDMNYAQFRAGDAGASSVGMLNLIFANGTTATAYKNAANDAWTASGNKFFFGQFTYEAA
jgi:hypothetical protein